MKNPSTTPIFAATLLVVLAAAFVPAAASAGQPSGTVVAGMEAPDFAADVGEAADFRLSALRGRTVILYFYPKDDTPGCTREALGFQRHIEAFRSLGAVVVGVSRDDLDSHREFSADLQLTFTLVPDPEGRIHDLFGAWKQDSLWGRIAFGVERSTFLIGPDGVVRKVWRDVSPADHAQEVLDYLREEEAGVKARW
jgi:peroxiredoxin Q/BCP